MQRLLEAAQAAAADAGRQLHQLWLFRGRPKGFCCLVRWPATQRGQRPFWLRMTSATTAAAGEIPPQPAMAHPQENAQV
jgi:hypothetical protein